MADKVTQKRASEQQATTTPEDATVKASVDTGDRELSDADLDRVSGGAQSTEPPPRRTTPPARAL